MTLTELIYNHSTVYIHAGTLLNSYANSKIYVYVVNADPQQCEHYNVISMTLYTEEHWHMQN